MSKQIISFRLNYIVLPLAILFISVILIAFFYRLLPAELAYSFKPGAADNWASRGAIVSWTLVPQFILAMLAAAVVWGVVRLSTRFRQFDSNWIRPGRVLSLMGNMLALPQIILSFAMLDIFVYNTYQTHLIPLWMFALIVLALGGVYLAVFFIQTLRRVKEFGQSASDRSFKE